MFAYGHDLFMARIRPEGKFDMIDEDFPFPVLFAFIFVLIVGNIATRMFMNNRALKKGYLTL